MKSERRHELQRNELADRLARGIESTRSFLPFILGGLALAAVVCTGWGLYSMSAKKKASVAWTEFYFNLTAGDADSFIEVAEDHPQSAAAGWARQIAGDSYLQRGIDTLYRNKSDGVKLIEQAIEAFEQVDKTALNPELRVKALLGLAQSHESLGHIEEAVGFYQQVAKSASQSGLINEANQRLAFLTSETGKNFYAWFVTLDPKPDAPITLPSDMMVPPSSPDIQFGPSDAGASTSPGAQAEIGFGDLPVIPAGGVTVPAESSNAAGLPFPDLPVAVPTPEVPSADTPVAEKPAAATELKLEP